MKTIPKKYDSPRRWPEAMRRMRSWRSRGLSSAAIAGHFCRCYCEAEDNSVRRLALLMLGAVMDFDNPSVARRALDMCHITSPDSASVGECIEIELRRHGLVAPLLRSLPDGPAIACASGLEPQLGIASASDLARMVCLSERRQVYGYRHPAGSLELVILNSCQQDILIDEEKFCDEPPLYFTESSHFTSPLWELSRWRDALLRLMSEVGYPALPIGLTACFTSPRATLINLDEYAVGPRGETKAGRLLARHTTRGYFVPAVAPLLPEGAQDTLARLLGIAAEMFENQK